jgi:hypothetical protein
MSFARRLFRSIFTVCGTDIDVDKHEYASVNVTNDGIKESGSCIDEEVQSITKRRRAMTMDTERMSCYSVDRNSCVSSDDESYGENRMPSILLGQVVGQDCDKDTQNDIVVELEFLQDPITLEPLCEPKYSFTCAVGGKVIEYNLGSFVEYLLSTGDFRDPITRTELSAEEIESLDNRVLSENLNYPTLMDKFNDKAAADVTENEINVIRGLESCIGEVIVDILRIIEEPTKTASYQLQILFSELDLPFQEMKTLSLEAAYQALLTWIMFLKGPPKKPTKDIYGRLNYAITYLNSQWTADDKAKMEIIRAPSRSNAKQ